MDEKRILEEAINVFGVDNQTDMISEEAGELVAAVNQFKRSRKTIEEFLEEVVDVEIMLEQARIMYDPEDEYCSMIRQKKLKRLGKRVAQERNKQRRSG